MWDDVTKDEFSIYKVWDDDMSNVTLKFDIFQVINSKIFINKDLITFWIDKKFSNKIIIHD